jgi:hypothetical protein
MNTIKRLMITLVVILALSGGFVLGQLNPMQYIAAASQASNDTAIVNPSTGNRADGGFAMKWWYLGGGNDFNKSLEISGYPISDLRTETLEDGKSYQVQYFERVRMEYHPENQPPYNVLLGAFGRQVMNGGNGCAPTSGNGGNNGPQGPSVCSVPSVGDLEAMPKATIEMAPDNTWFHRVFNERLFNAANNWGGADSWFLAFLKGPNKGGAWTSYHNPGEIIYRATSTHTEWCLGVATAAQYKAQFMDGASGNAAMNVRIKPGPPAMVVTSRSSCRIPVRWSSPCRSTWLRRPSSRRSGSAPMTARWASIPSMLGDGHFAMGGGERGLQHAHPSAYGRTSLRLVRSH